MGKTYLISCHLTNSLIRNTTMGEKATAEIRNQDRSNSVGKGVSLSLSSHRTTYEYKTCKHNLENKQEHR